MEPRFVTWVPAKNGNHPKFAVHAGIDKGNKLYVARARYNNGVIPGKVVVGHTSAYISYDGKEVPMANYEVLVAPPATLSWVDCLGSNIPPFALPGGQDPNGETYYIGRVFHQGTVTVGKVHPSHGTCYVPHGGLEYPYTDYEILVKNKLGRAMNV